LACFEPGVYCWGFAGLVVGLVGLARASLYTRTREKMCVDFGFSTYLIPGLLALQKAHQ